MGDLTHPSRGNVAGQNVCFIHTWYCDSPAEWQEGATGRCPRCRLCRWFHWLQLCPPRAESGVGSSPIPTHTLLLLFSLYSYPSSQHKNLRVVLKPLSPRCQTHSPATPTPPSPPPPNQRCFRAEISGWGAVCVWGQTCPSFDTRADSDSNWAADQDHSLLSPLLPPQSSPTHDMCHCHRSALEDLTSWRSGQIPKAGKQRRGWVGGNSTSFHWWTI